MIELRNGDCYDIISEIPDNSIDLVITDPPYKFDSLVGGFYCKNKSSHRRYAEELRNLNCCDFNPYVFLDTVKSKLKKIYIYVFCNKSLVADYITWAKGNKCNFDILVMCKSNPIPAYNNHYLSDLEYVIVIREHGTYFSKEKDLDLYRKFFLTSCKKGLHPAEKPVPLLEKFIKVASPENAIVMDCFMGSGSTGVACMNTGRSFIGIEKDTKYFKIAEQRIRHAENERKESKITSLYGGVD